MASGIILPEKGTILESATRVTKKLQIEEEDFCQMMFDQYMLGTTTAMEDTAKFVSSFYEMISVKQKELRKDRTREALYGKFKEQLKEHKKSVFESASPIIMA